MINNYIQFISNNVKGLQSLEKRIKVFEYLKIEFPIMGLYFFKRCTPPYLMKKDGSMSLTKNLFSRTGIATLLEWSLVS